MIVRKIRLQRGWSQEQLAELSGLSVRTIQRIERGQSAGLESLKSLAAVFELQVSDLQSELTMNTPTSATLSQEEERAIEYVRDLKGFYGHLTSFAITIPCLLILNLYLTPSYLWIWWVVLGWGVGLALHAITTFEIFNFLDADWEKKQIEKRLGRKL